MQVTKSNTFKLVKAALLVSCFFMFSCENDQKQVDEMFSKKTAVEEAAGVESYLSQGGKVKAKLTAPYMLRYLIDSPYLEFNRTLHVDFYNDSNQVESILDAHYAKHKEFQRTVLLRDSVVIINKVNGDTLKTDELWWDQNKQEFYTDKVVHIYQRTGYTIGKFGLRAKQDFSEWWILGSSGQRMVSDDGIPQ
ncbi:MAG: LPS export ABC transporter periplasmic protein LptC [Chitinophagaceae bacterium]|uniref:LPS export ABC transporter periplasmic protein LptC n=1 Tax=unclassified Paraflavitalea TaxID=2798305 RepID=UPI003D33D49C|nr:LPS export ABC transporter periplasmic protein LptC [Chitinophagaceae bacterium]